MDGESLRDIDYSHIINMSYMFHGCSSLITIPQLDTSNVTDMYTMFDGCSSLEYIEDPACFPNYDWSETYS